MGMSGFTQIMQANMPQTTTLGQNILASNSLKRKLNDDYDQT